MMRDPLNWENMVVTVKLKTGHIFRDKDITSGFSGNTERVISFWHNDSVRVYPLQDIEYYELKEK